MREAARGQRSSWERQARSANSQMRGDVGGGAARSLAVRVGNVEMVRTRRGRVMRALKPRSTGKCPAHAELYSPAEELNRSWSTIFDMRDTHDMGGHEDHLSSTTPKAHLPECLAAPECACPILRRRPETCTPSRRLLHHQQYQQCLWTR